MPRSTPRSAAISNVTPDATLRARARRLFALALETPGGLKVQTIHAFCTRLLHQFPFEANVAARFDVLDEAAEAQLLGEISLGVLLDAAQSPEGALGRALAAPSPRPPTRPSRTWSARRSASATRCAPGSSTTAASRRPSPGSAARSASPATTRSTQVDSEMTDGPAAAGVAMGRPSPRRSRRDRRAIRSRPDDCWRRWRAAGSERADLYLEVFLTGSRSSRASDWSPKRSKLAIRSSPIASAANARASCALAERRKALACRDRTAALLTIADAVISRYQTEKDRRGLLDYDDLIDKRSSCCARSARPGCTTSSTTASITC